MQTHAFNTATARELAAAGDFVAYVACSSNATDQGIIVRPDQGGATFELMPGQQIRLPVKFRRLLVAPRSAAALAGSLLVGEGDFRDGRVGGTVETVDGGRIRTLEGRAFSAQGSRTGGASLYASLLLWNPANSGRRIICKQVLLRADLTLASSIRITLESAALGVVGNAPVNKLAGGPASTMEWRTQLAGTQLPGAVIFGVSLPAAGSMLVTTGEPIICPPGYGIGIGNDTQNAVMAGWIDYHEETV